MAAKNKWITTKQAAIEINRSLRTVQDYCKAGKVDYALFGRYYMIDLKSWEEFKARYIRKAS